ncbi:hypothetical protein ACFFJY_10290 [Fictibacillus aquaticus]|uniref:Uncharacterized protein n=1 Tax=Fictibacillus aquaticus TaxID=2021314 RepID=A0A235FCG4_9BACL|nr:hypothetical protein [Fictibacillus aquaticus]OYD58647.1 hypothetical protein CGZ90_01735 [Fictibacillus aquaticus]
MAFYFFLYWHFFVMVMLVMLLSGLTAAFFPRVHILKIAAASAISGILYAVIYDVIELSFYPAVMNIVFSLLSTGIIKYNHFLRKTAEEIEAKDR